MAACEQCFAEFPDEIYIKFCPSCGFERAGKTSMIVHGSCSDESFISIYCKHLKLLYNTLRAVCTDNFYDGKMLTTEYMLQINFVVKMPGLNHKFSYCLCKQALM